MDILYTLTMTGLSDSTEKVAGDCRDQGQNEEIRLGNINKTECVKMGTDTRRL
jgi:hypothetical protein